MEKLFANMLGWGLAVLTISGFLPGGRRRHLLGMMNTDTNHSALRLPLTLALLYAGSSRSGLKTTRYILTGVGALYIVIGLTGTRAKRLGGMLPSGLTNFDIVYHLCVGAAALWLGARPGRMLKP